MLEKETRT